MRRTGLSRRQFLRGAGGISLALPLLHAADGRAEQQGAVPKRLLLFYVAEGIERKYWWPVPGPSKAPTDFSLDGTCLASLAPYRSRMTVVKGVNTESTKVLSGCYHGFCMPHVLTGGPNSPAQKYTDRASNTARTLAPGISIDRAVAQAIQGSAPFGSYEIGVRAYADKGVQVLSFDQKGAGRYPERNPYQVFLTMFGGGPGASNADANRTIEETHRRRMSVLDALKNEIAALRCRVGNDGREKLDAHLGGIRTIEQQLTALAQRQDKLPALQVGPEWDAMSRDLNKVPDLANLQMQLVRSMLAADLTRVVLIQFGHTVCRWTFPFVPGMTLTSADHHDKLSHMEGAVKAYGVTTDQVIEEKRKVYTWFAERFKAMLDMLDAVPEANGARLLDNTGVIHFSEMGYGQTHDANNIPIIVAGGAQRAFKLGQHLDLNASYKGMYSKAGDTGRSVNDLWLTVAQAYGLPLASFGEAAFSKGPIAELLA